MQLNPNVWFNPHRTPLSGRDFSFLIFVSVGNYDLNVIERLLFTKGFETKWQDARKGTHPTPMLLTFPEIDNEALSSCYGILFNKVSKRFLLVTSHHWFCAKRVDSKFVLMDSADPRPRAETMEGVPPHLA